MTTGNDRERNFILQQGFQELHGSGGCSVQYSALHFQPRVILAWLVAAILLQSPLMFFLMAAVLWWSASLPTLNPFEALYNWVEGRRPGGFRISSAPAPRRTAQAIAGGLALACGVLIHGGFAKAGYAMEALFLGAVLALTLGSFCLGSFLYHLFAGRLDFARRTLPWSH